MHFWSNLFLVALNTLGLLLSFILCPMAIWAEEKGVTLVEADLRTTVPDPEIPLISQVAQQENELQEQFFFIQPLAMGARLTYENSNESRKSRGTTDKDSDHRFKESVRLKTKGWVYHPALMQYSLMVEPEWIQGREENSSAESVESAEVSLFSPDYSVLATFLEQKPYTLNVFSSRVETPVWAPFAGNTESAVDTYGTDLLFKNKILPTTLGYSHTETDQTGFYNSQNSYDNFTLSSRHLGTKSKTTINSTYRDDDRTTEGIERQINTWYNSLLNTYLLTEDKKVKLYSNLYYRTQETDDFETENIRLKEHLNWWHRDNLQSNYIVSHTRQETDDFDSDQTSFEARLTHLLYENLTTDFGGKTSLDNFSDGRENAYNVFLDFDYTRTIPWGTLNLNSGWDYLYTDRGGFTDSVVQVTGEPQALSIGEETLLDNFNVDIDSIIVTNSPGTIVYLENIDYTIDEIGDFVRIRRLTFGSIREGEVVAVNYRFLLDGEYDDTVFTQNYGINSQLWQDWWFYYDYMQARQKIQSGQVPQNLIDDTIHRAQVRYDIGWSDTNLSYEDNNRQSDLSFTRWEIEETLRYRPYWRFYFTLRGYLGQTDYTDRDEMSDFYGGVTILDWLFSRRWKLRFEGYYQNISGDREDTENRGIKADLEFRYRIWTMHLSYQLTDQNNLVNDFQRIEQLVRFELIRIMW